MVLELVFFVLVFFEVVFFEPVFFRDGDLRALDLRLTADFFVTFFLDFVDGLRVDRFVAVTFLRDAFFVAVFFADFLADFFATLRPGFRPTLFLDDFLRAADFREDAALVRDFFRLTFRFLPAAFLLDGALRDAAFFLLAPAALRFLLAAFFAGISTPAGLRKTRNYTSLAPTWKRNLGRLRLREQGRRGRQDPGRPAP